MSQMRDLTNVDLFRAFGVFRPTPKRRKPRKSAPEPQEQVSEVEVDPRFTTNWGDDGTWRWFMHVDEPDQDIVDVTSIDEWMEALWP